MSIDIQEMIKQMQPQKDEFNALDNLIKQYQSLPAIVDNDYPRCRHYYESAIKTFLEACKNNRRI